MSTAVEVPVDAVEEQATGDCWHKIHGKTKKEIASKIAVNARMFPASGYRTNFLIQITKHPAGYWWCVLHCYPLYGRQ